MCSLVRNASKTEEIVAITESRRRGRGRNSSTDSVMKPTASVSLLMAERASPKSQILRSQFALSNKFEGFKSRCSTLSSGSIRRHRRCLCQQIVNARKGQEQKREKAHAAECRALRPRSVWLRVQRSSREVSSHERELDGNEANWSALEEVLTAERRDAKV